MSGQVSRGSIGAYQPDERAGVARLCWRVSGSDYLAGEGAYVSDRRWVKIVGLLRIAAATEVRQIVSQWDLWLLPWCVAADSACQDKVAAWLASRLGVREAISPVRLTRVIEAFEAQVRIEEKAEDRS